MERMNLQYMSLHNTDKCAVMVTKTQLLQMDRATLRVEIFTTSAAWLYKK